MDENVTISKKRYISLLRAEAHLEQLEIRGVDNWSGYVGAVYYCNKCHNKTEWFEMENDKCSHCGNGIKLW